MVAGSTGEQGGAVELRTQNSVPSVILVTILLLAFNYAFVSFGIKLSK